MARRHQLGFQGSGGRASCYLLGTAQGIPSQCWLHWHPDLDESAEYVSAFTDQRTFQLTRAVLVSFAFGAICVILILFKYLRAKIGFDSYASASASKSYAAGSVAGVETTTSRVGRSAPKGLRARVDGWLVVRFTIAFLILR